MNILVTGAFKEYDKLKNQFNEHSFVFFQNEQDSIDFDVSSFEYVICNSLFLYNDIKKFSSLNYIQVTSAGLDRLPMDYIEKNNIKVFNARGVYSIPMAEWTLCKLLDVYKKSFMIYENQKNKIWEKQRDILELNGKNATIIGFGSVGQEIAKRLYAFNVNINVVDIKLFENELINKSFTIDDLTEAIKNVDIIIITLPLNEQTEGLFNQSLFNIIEGKPIIINISRGRVIKTDDLIMMHNKFSNIILDVFDNEPLDKASQLWNLENIIITSHNSFIGEHNNERLFSLINKNLKSITRVN